jgi:hypothetical protein
VIHAEGELQASGDKGSTVVFPLPVKVLGGVMDRLRGKPAKE